MAFAQPIVLCAFILYSNIVTGSTPPLKVSFNGENDAHSPDIDGPWPTIPLHYTDSSGASAQLDCYLTLWPESVFITTQTCVASLPRNESAVLCTDGLAFPRFYHPKAQASASSTPFNITQWREEFEWNQDNTTLYGYSFEGVETSYLAVSELPQNLHVDGLGAQTEDNITIGTTTLNNLPLIVGNTFSQTLYNVSGTVPILGSMLSLFGGGVNASLSANQSNNLIPALYDRGIIPSKSFTLHMGSVQPWSSGSLYLGGYDKSRIMNNVSVTLIDPDNPLYLNSINIGVERGYFPLKSNFTTDVENGGFFQGPWYIAPVQELFSGDRQTDVAIEPGLPYMYLPRGYCDSIAEVLQLEYDEARNLYLWTLPPTHPLFQSPSYLELGFGLYGDAFDEAPVYTTVKIPFALLQHTFHATLRARNGTLVTPAHYFPCSPTGQIPANYNYDYDNREWQRDPTLGRAFLQAAFFGIDWHSGNQFIAQAPGPADQPSEYIIPLGAGDKIEGASAGAEPDADAWTKSWSGILPAWTINADGTILLLNGSDARIGMDGGEKTGIAAGTVLGAFLLGALIFVSIRLGRREHQKRTQNQLNMQQEDKVARAIEVEELEKERLLSVTIEEPEVVEETQDLGDRIHKIPRRPVATAFSDS